MHLKIVAAFVFLISAIVANPAEAQVQVSTLSAPTPIATPLSGFNVSWTMTGSKSGVGAATAQLTFYLSPTPTGSTGVAQLDTRQVLLRGSGLGPYFPPVGTQTTFISRFSMPANTVALLESITAACQPSTWYVLAVVDASPVRSTSALSMGSAKLPDFLFTGGTITPGTINPGGSTTMTFDVFTNCAAPRTSRVGIFFTDTSFNLIYQIGAAGVAAGAGTSTLPPTSIPIDPSIGPGDYNILLIADVDAVVAESNENNNGGAFLLHIVAPPLTTAGEPVKMSPSTIELTAEQLAALREQLRGQATTLHTEPPVAN